MILSAYVATAFITRTGPIGAPGVGIKGGRKRKGALAVAFRGGMMASFIYFRVAGFLIVAIFGLNLIMVISYVEEEWKVFYPVTILWFLFCMALLLLSLGA